MGNYHQKTGKGKLPSFRDNGEHAISIYGDHLLSIHIQEISPLVRLLESLHGP